MQNVCYFAKICFMMAKHRYLYSKTSMHNTYFFKDDHLLFVMIIFFLQNNQPRSK